MNVWEFIHVKYIAGIPVMLMYVLESKGSSPGRQGFVMAVAKDGMLFGTIGGGIMEHKFVEMARARLTGKTRESALHKQVHDKGAAKDQSGMICSGEQTIFLYEVGKHDIINIAELIESLNNHRNGSLELSMTGISFSPKIPLQDFHFQQQGVDDFILIEKTGYKQYLYIVGGGHCSLALSRIMRNMDFYIHVFDERKGLNTMEQNSYAHEKTVLNCYSALAEIIRNEKDAYVVIMTSGYRGDDAAMRALMHKSFKYIGLLGSGKKVEKMFADYRNEKTEERILQQIHSPVGIQIKSRTMEEIAVSIAAEIIAVKNSDQ